MVRGIPPLLALVLLFWLVSLASAQTAVREGRFSIPPWADKARRRANGPARMRNSETSAVRES